MLYREHGPNEIVRVEGTLNPRRVADTAHVEPPDLTDPRGTPETMLSNADVTVAISRRSAAMPFAYRNTDGDLLYFVHKGTGQFATEFGRLPYEPGDYVLLPKARSGADAGESHMLVVGRPPCHDRAPAGRAKPVDPTVLVLPELHTHRGRARSGNCESSTMAPTAPSSTDTTRPRRSAGRVTCSLTS
jgi:homogentisate 1,2-dioxygenase